MAKTENLHQPTFDVLSKGGLKCEAPGCNYFLVVPREEWLETWKPYFLREHTYQFDEGRARDIEVEWVISATCSVCPNGGNIEVIDSEAIECTECHTTWTMSGREGRLDESESEEAGA